MMLSSYPLWWLALPVLLLPVWWHRQKRQRLKAELLATARFLPSAPPEQLRVWQWRDKVLLLARCLLLAVLIAWLAATIFPWRGDTVLVDAGADKAWTEQQITAAGFASATRIALPPDALQWLRANERDWRPAAKVLIVSRADQIAMPARLPQFSHQVELRTVAAAAASASTLPPATASASASALPSATAPVSAGVSPSATAPGRVEQRVTLAVSDTRAAAWRSLFAAFDAAGAATTRYMLTAEPDAGTMLIVWDTPNAAPPSTWRAANWWVASATHSNIAAAALPSPAAVAARPSTVAETPVAPTAFPELSRASTLTINGLTLKYADSPRGRLWTSDAFPPRDADTARALYESWQQLSAAPSPAYATPSQTFGAARSAPPAITDARPERWLALALLALFIIERILTHVRRN